MQDIQAFTLQLKLHDFSSFGLVISWMFIQNNLKLLDLQELPKPAPIPFEDQDLPAEHCQAAVLFWKWFRAQEQHMFAEMRKPWKILRITEIS